MLHVISAKSIICSCIGGGFLFTATYLTVLASRSTENTIKAYTGTDTDSLSSDLDDVYSEAEQAAQIDFAKNLKLINNDLLDPEKKAQYIEGQESDYAEVFSRGLIDTVNILAKFDGNTKVAQINQEVAAILDQDLSVTDEEIQEEIENLDEEIETPLIDEKQPVQALPKECSEDDTECIKPIKPETDLDKPTAVIEKETTEDDKESVEPISLEVSGATSKPKDPEPDAVIENDSGEEETDDQSKKDTGSTEEKPQPTPDSVISSTNDDLDSSKNPEQQLPPTDLESNSLDSDDKSEEVEIVSETTTLLQAVPGSSSQAVLDELSKPINPSSEKINVDPDEGQKLEDGQKDPVIVSADPNKPTTELLSPTKTEVTDAGAESQKEEVVEPSKTVTTSTETVQVDGEPVTGTVRPVSNQSPAAESPIDSVSNTAKVVIESSDSTGAVVSNETIQSTTQTLPAGSESITPASSSDSGKTTDTTTPKDTEKDVVINVDSGNKGTDDVLDVSGDQNKTDSESTETQQQITVDGESSVVNADLDSSKTEVTPLSTDSESSSQGGAGESEQLVTPPITTLVGSSSSAANDGEQSVGTGSPVSSQSSTPTLEGATETINPASGGESDQVEDPSTTTENTEVVVEIVGGLGGEGSGDQSKTDSESNNNGSGDSSEQLLTPSATTQSVGSSSGTANESAPSDVTVSAVSTQTTTTTLPVSTTSNSEVVVDELNKAEDQTKSEEKTDADPDKSQQAEDGKQDPVIVSSDTSKPAADPLSPPKTEATLDDAKQPVEGIEDQGEKVDDPSKTDTESTEIAKVDGAPSDVTVSPVSTQTTTTTLPTGPVSDVTKVGEDLSGQTIESGTDETVQTPTPTLPGATESINTTGGGGSDQPAEPSTTSENTDTDVAIVGGLGEEGSGDPSKTVTESTDTQLQLTQDGTVSTTNDGLDSSKTQEIQLPPNPESSTSVSGDESNQPADPTTSENTETDVVINDDSGDEGKDDTTSVTGDQTETNTESPSTTEDTSQEGGTGEDGTDEQSNTDTETQETPETEEIPEPIAVANDDANDGTNTEDTTVAEETENPPTLPPAEPNEETDSTVDGDGDEGQGGGEEDQGSNEDETIGGGDEENVETCEENDGTCKEGEPDPTKNCEEDGTCEETKVVISDNCEKGGEECTEETTVENCQEEDASCDAAKPVTSENCEEGNTECTKETNGVVCQDAETCEVSKPIPSESCEEGTDCAKETTEEDCKESETCEVTKPVVCEDGTECAEEDCEEGVETCEKPIEPTVASCEGDDQTCKETDPLQPVVCEEGEDQVCEEEIIPLPADDCEADDEACEDKTPPTEEEEEEEEPKPTEYILFATSTLGKGASMPRLDNSKDSKNYLCSLYGNKDLDCYIEKLDFSTLTDKYYEFGTIKDTIPTHNITNNHLKTQHNIFKLKINETLFNALKWTANEKVQIVSNANNAPVFGALKPIFALKDNEYYGNVSSFLATPTLFTRDNGTSGQDSMFTYGKTFKCFFGKGPLRNCEINWLEIPENATSQTSLIPNKLKIDQEYYVRYTYTPLPITSIQAINTDCNNLNANVYMGDKLANNSVQKILFKDLKPVIKLNIPNMPLIILNPLDDSSTDKPDCPS